MICPVCKTNNANFSDVQHCIQCGSDLYVHHLLHEVGEAIQMENEIVKTKQESPEKLAWLLIIGQIGPAILLVMCAVFGIFVGMRFLAFIDYEEYSRLSTAKKQSEVVFEQLQQMNATIKQEFDLILDQRRENQALQTKIQELTVTISKNTESMVVVPPSAQGEKH